MDQINSNIHSPMRRKFWNTRDGLVIQGEIQWKIFHWQVNTPECRITFTSVTIVDTNCNSICSVVLHLCNHFIIEASLSLQCTTRHVTRIYRIVHLLKYSQSWASAFVNKSLDVVKAALLLLTSPSSPIIPYITAVGSFVRLTLRPRQLWRAESH